MVAMAAAPSERTGRYAPKLVEAGLVGAAALSTIELLRRRQARRREPGHRIPLPDPSLAKAELALRRSSAPNRETLVDEALADLVASLRQQAQTPPPILGVLVDDEAVEVLLAEPAAPPRRWHVSADGFGWRIASPELEGRGALESPPLPALAAVGRVASGRADTLINLEAAGLLSVSGDPVSAVGLLWSMATHLVGTPRAGALNLILIGFPTELAQTENTRSAASIAEVADELRATSEVMAAAARQSGCDDLFTARLRQAAGDGWPPVVVFSATPLDSEELRFLDSVAQPGRGVAAVVVNADGATRWKLDTTAHPCPVHPLRLAIEPMVMDPGAVAVVSELLRIAGDTRGAVRTEPPYDRIDLSAENRESVPSPVDPAPHIVVRVLGTVEVDGAADFKRAKSRELVVYLAMHPNGVGEAELDEALWGTNGTRVVAPSTRDSTVSVARTALGGPRRLLPAQGQGREKRYQLGPEVASDWQHFCALHRLGRQQRSPDTLRQALELVRGRPFQAVVSGRTYGWVHTEGHVRHMEAEVADAADLASGLFLERGDAPSARWAARQGLLAEPYTERLWVRLMEAADALGESQEIERIMDEMDVVLELEGDFSALHPNTLAAYDRLSRRRQHRATA
jgi:DNA-binding SARP family transcriptional activator